MFRKLAKQDVELGSGAVRDQSAPPFGTSTSDAAVVAEFYAYWGAYASAMTFAWCDECVTPTRTHTHKHTHCAPCTSRDSWQRPRLLPRTRSATCAAAARLTMWLCPGGGDPRVVAQVQPG